MKIFNYPFKALFDTGAARSLLHINVFNKIVSDQINCSESGAMTPQQLIYSESDVDLFDIVTWRSRDIGMRHPALISFLGNKQGRMYECIRPYFV